MMRIASMPLHQWTALGIAVASVLFGGSAVLAQTPAEAVCKAKGSGLAFSMKTFIDLKTPKEVALEQTGLAKGGPRYRIAEAAYTQLASGVGIDEAMRRATRLCLQIGADAVEDDEPTFETQRADGGGAQLCSDLASSMAGYLVDEPGATSLSVDKALDQFRSSDPRDMAAPRQRAAMDIAMRIARVNPDREKISTAVFDYCEKLSPQARIELEKEFYVP